MTIGMRYGEEDFIRARRSAVAIAPDRQLKVLQNKLNFFDTEIAKLEDERAKVAAQITELAASLPPVEEAPKVTKLVKKKDADKSN